jgi:peroxiredoxin
MKSIVGDKAPEFNLQDTSGKYISLESMLGEQNVLLLFFPLAFSSTCTEEVCSIRDNLKIYDSLSTKVIGISVDSFFSLKEFKKSNNLNFTLLSDFNKEASEAYGVLYEDFYGMKGVSKRASFVINETGVIIYKEVLEEAGDLPNFKAIIEAIRHSKD